MFKTRNQPKQQYTYRDIGEFLDDVPFTQKEVAARIGISVNHLNMIACRNRQPSLDVALRICRLIDIPPASLVLGPLIDRVGVTRDRRERGYVRKKRTMTEA